MSNHFLTETETLSKPCDEIAAEEELEDDGGPVWFDGKSVNEVLFASWYLYEHKLVFTDNAFFSPDGRITDEMPLKGAIFQELQLYTMKNVSRTVNNILEVLKLSAYVPDLPPQPDRIHLDNGTLFLDGQFVEGRTEVVRNRLPVAYNPNAPNPEQWLKFLWDLLYPEDIPTLQEYLGYCLIPSTLGQSMMILKGKGGEGKSQIGVVLSRLFGTNMKDGSIGKISENRFARADLEHVLLCVDDDMKLSALRETNYVKAIVTAQGRMDLERKGKQSYQGWMYARLLAFSNGDLQALYDRSDGFYRRQLILNTKNRPPDRVDDPYLAEKLCTEVEGIFLWAFEGLQRLVANQFRFTQSDRTRENRESVKRETNNLYDFLEDQAYIRFAEGASVTSKELHAVYNLWCEENCVTPLKARSFSDMMLANLDRYSISRSNKIRNSSGHLVRGFVGLEPLVQPGINWTGSSSLDEFWKDVDDNEKLPF